MIPEVKTSSPDFLQKLIFSIGKLTFNNNLMKTFKDWPVLSSSVVNLWFMLLFELSVHVISVYFKIISVNMWRKTALATMLWKFHQSQNDAIKSVTLNTFYLLKYFANPKIEKICYQLLTLMLFQTCMSVFLLMSTK